MQHYEDRQALRRAVEKHLGRELSDDEWGDIAPGWFPPYDEVDLRELLAQLHERGIAPRQRDPLEVAGLKMRLRAERGADRYEDTIRNIRQEVFGDPEAPFPDNLKAAREWIEAEATKATETEGELLGQLEYVCEDHYVRKVNVLEGTRLAELWRHTKAIAFHLGWHQCEVVRWLLTGSWEPPSPVSYSWGPGGPITLTVRSPDVPADFVQALYKALRRAAWGRQRAEPVSEDIEDSVRRAITLVEFVEPKLKLRDRWAKLKRESRSLTTKRLATVILKEETWAKWWIEWNRRYGERGWDFEYPDAMRIAYNRAKKRMSQ